MDEERTPLKDQKQALAYDIVSAIFITVTLAANLIASYKTTSIFGLEVGVGVWFFPLAFVINDLLSEVFHERVYRVIWIGWSCLFGALAIAHIILLLPDPFPDVHAAWNKVFGMSFRLGTASLIAFLIGNRLNAYVLLKMRSRNPRGRMSWRFLLSTIVGQLADSAIFYPAAFMGADNWPVDRVMRVMFANCTAKILTEIALLPLTCVIAVSLKSWIGRNAEDA